MSVTKTLYFDESGQTGTKLLDTNQLYFSVGSTDLEAGDAKTLISQHFPKHNESDLKFRKLFRRPSNYAALVDFARSAGAIGDRFFCYLIDKRFATLAKMVDWFVEPVVSSDGYDWYKNDYGRRWVNMFHFALSLPGNDVLLDEIITLYDQLVSELTEDALSKMQLRYTQLAESGPETIRPFMELVALGANAFKQRYSLNSFTDPNDIHVTSVVSSVGWWRARHKEDFAIIHDQSTHFFKRQGLWDRVTSMDASKGVVQVGSKSLTFPLRVLSTSAGDSKLLPSLQICDLIAGFVARTKSAKLNDDESRVIEQMIEAGLGEIGFNSVEPGDDFVEGSPAVANGPDAVDQVSTLTQRR